MSILAREEIVQHRCMRWSWLRFVEAVAARQQSASKMHVMAAWNSSRLNCVTLCSMMLPQWLLLGFLLLLGVAGLHVGAMHPARGERLHPSAGASKYHRDAEILSVPGFDGELPSRQYGGYIDVAADGAEHGRYLYFYFVTSNRDPTTDPVLLWLNGGPGCSSFDGEEGMMGG